MAAKLDYKQMANDIIKLAGGAENVSSLGHCMTRLRFILKNEELADAESIKKIKGVLGVVSSNGQFMVILGQNLLPVFETIMKNYALGAGNVTNENLDAVEKGPLTLKSAGSAVLGYISAAVTPLIAGLIAGGMLKVFILLFNMVYDFSGTTTYTLLSGLADAPFYFMPIFIAYGAAVKLGGTPIYSMICAAALLHGNFIALVAAGEAVTMFGLPVRLVSYSSSLLPALLIALVAYYAEKLLNKVVPGIFKAIFVGMGTLFITMTLGYTVLGPLGNFCGSYISQLFVFMGSKIGFITLGILAGAMPWLIMCGVHTTFGGFMAQSLADVGYDSIFRPCLLLHNMAEGGACIGVGLRTKKLETRSEAFSLGFGCIVAGVTEPAIYGLNLPRRKPMLGVMAGGAAGGIVAGLFGCRNYTMGYSTILALPIFEDTMIGMAIAVVVAIVVAALVTFILGFEEAEAGVAPAAVADEAIVAVADGNLIRIEEVKDEAFASKMLGDGVAFELRGGIITAPCNGVVSALMDTGHAFGMTRPDGVEILVHIGIDTVSMQGEGFCTLVKQGDTVKAGEPVVKIDLDLLRNKGFDMTTMLIIVNPNGRTIKLASPKAVTCGEIISE